MKTGDILRLELDNGVVDAWEILGFYYGEVEQENVIELRKVASKLPDESIPSFVPVDLIRKAIETNLLTKCVQKGSSRQID
jgi:hypothetical protein